MTLSPHSPSARMERLLYVANRSTAQIIIKMGRGMFLPVFFFAISKLLSLFFAIPLFTPAHAEQIREGHKEKRRHSHPVRECQNSFRADKADQPAVILFPWQKALR